MDVTHQLNYSHFLLTLFLQCFYSRNRIFFFFPSFRPRPGCTKKWKITICQKPLVLVYKSPTKQQQRKKGKNRFRLHSDSMKIFSLIRYSIHTCITNVIRLSPCFRKFLCYQLITPSRSNA